MFDLGVDRSQNRLVERLELSINDSKDDIIPLLHHRVAKDRPGVTNYIVLTLIDLEIILRVIETYVSLTDH